MSSLLIIGCYLMVRTPHPVMVCLSLVFLSANVALIGGLVFSKWFTCVVFLIFLGGMMVAFLYIATLAMNLKLRSIKKKHLLLLFFFSLVVTSGLSPNYSASLSSDLTAFFHASWATIIVFLVGYLLCALLLSVKSAQSFKGALTKKW